jgi:hypothetical protein
MGKAVVISFTNEDPRYVVGSTDTDERPPRTLCDALCDYLRRCGIQCSNPLEYSFYGWSSDARLFGRCLLIIVQRGNQWDITVAQTGFTNFLRAERSLNETFTRARDLIIEWIKGELDGSSEVNVEEQFAPASF